MVRVPIMGLTHVMVTIPKATRAPPHSWSRTVVDLAPVFLENLLGRFLDETPRSLRHIFVQLAQYCEAVRLMLGQRFRSRQPCQASTCPLRSSDRCVR